MITPGPWTLTADPFAVVIQDSSENTICEFTIDSAEDAELYAEADPTVRPISEGEARANARLFMAAPELLAILRDAIAIVEEERSSIIDCATVNGPDGKPDMSTIEEDAKPDVDRYGLVIASARAAIAKAEGR